MHQVDTSLKSYKRPQHARSQMAEAASDRLRRWVGANLPLLTKTTVRPNGAWTVAFHTNRPPSFCHPEKMKVDVDIVLITDNTQRVRFKIYDFGNIIQREPRVRDGQMYRINERQGIIIHLVIPQYTALDMRFNARFTTRYGANFLESWIDNDSITFFLDETYTDITAKKIFDGLSTASNFTHMPRRFPRRGNSGSEGMSDSSEED